MPEYQEHDERRYTENNTAHDKTVQESLLGKNEPETPEINGEEQDERRKNDYQQGFTIELL